MLSRLDIIIFGATGFTGKYVVRELNRIIKSENLPYSWGIAGRSEEKLKNVLKEIEQKSGDDLKHIKIIIADITEQSSIDLMAEKAKLIINCCGPYRFYGEPVVKACVAKKTHHVDVSGEPQYMEKMQLLYNKTASENGVYIVSACGFDSIPADMGTIFVQNKFEGTVNSIETYLESWMVGNEPKSSSVAINTGTWESAIYGLTHANELKSLRKQLFPQRLPKLKPTLKARSALHYNNLIKNSWCVPFPGSDRSVVMRSQYYFYEKYKQRPIQMRAYLGVNSLWGLILLLVGALIFLVCTKFKLGRDLLLKYPKFFSFGVVAPGGPKPEDAARTQFQMTFIADGWSSDKLLSEPTDQYREATNRQMVARVKGMDPGYGATATMLVLSALTILREPEKLPTKGGVFPPGALFAKTSLIEHLNRNGIEFEVVSLKSKL